MKWYMLSLGLVLLMVGCQGRPETPEITIPQVTQMTEPEVEKPKENIVEKVEEPALPDVGEHFTLVPLSAEYLYGLTDGYAKGQTDQGYVIMDASGQVVSPNYESMTIIEDSHLVVAVDGKQGVIQPDGTEIIPLEYDAVGSGGASGYYQVTMDGKVGIVDENNQILLPLEYENAYWCGHGFCAQKGEKWGLIGENGENLTEFIYDYLPILWEEDVDVAGRDGKLGLLDWTGVERSPFRYDTVLDTKENRFALREGEQCDILNEQGVVLSSGTWSEHDLHCTRSGEDGIEEILDWDTGTWVPVTENPGESSSFIMVEDQRYKGVVDANGDVILPLEFQIINKDDRCFYAYKMGQWGAYGLDGKVLIPPQYKDCEDGGEGYFRVFDGQKWAVFGADGTQLTAFIFDDKLNRYECPYFEQGISYVEIDGTPYFLHTAVEEAPILSDSISKLVKIEVATKESIGNYEDIYEYIHDENGQFVMISVDKTVKDFQYISVKNTATDTEVLYEPDEVLFTTKELHPTKPFVVKQLPQGSIPWSGISFIDEHDVRKYYTIHLNGRDPDEAPPYYLMEFENS